jgi:hypothetical protein
VAISCQRLTASPSVATWGSFSARALPLFVLAPFVFRSLSGVEATLWFLLITLQGLQLLLEATVGMTFIRAIGFAMGGATQLRDQRLPDVDRVMGRANISLLSRIWLTMRGLYGLVGLVTVVLIGSLALWSAPSLIAQLENPHEGWAALALFVLGAGLRAYGGLHISYLYGVGRITLLRWWEMCFWVLAFLTALSMLLSGKGLLAVAAAYQIPLLVGLAWNVILTRRDQVGRKGLVRAGGVDWNVFGQLWPGMWRAGIGVASYLGVTQGAGLYYARIGPADEVAVYLFAMSLMRPMMQFAQVPFITKLPQLAALQAAGNRATQVALARRGMFLSYSLLAGLVLGAAGALPILAWVGGGEGARVPLLLWAVIGLAAYLERIGGMHLQLYSQTNHIVWHWANGGTAILFVLFSSLLLPGLGALAFPTALCLAILIFYMPYSMWHSYRCFTLAFPKFELRTSGGPLLVMVLVLSAIGVLTSYGTDTLI